METFRLRSMVFNNHILLLNNTFLLLLSRDYYFREQSFTCHQYDDMSFLVVNFIPDVFLRQSTINWYVITRLLQDR